ncbi:helix-turn-helix domain-containing protein [Entomohabitans teleogrylli]|uniref:helix-turn-helix domain-containing protein n=1 Tax=Entomohabitans teleogrylli TaxID=1384589 RepID=UPI00073D8EDE|nr:helix-turn-helix domain-containing protein [Entomohabitans teleogrylli]
MQQLIVEHWRVHYREAARGVVVPDGCRDIIFFHHGEWRRKLTLTELDSCAYRVEGAAGDRYEGFRLRPDCVIDGGRLRRYLDDPRLTPDHPRLMSIIHDTVSVDGQLAEALQALQEIGDLSGASQLLGVSGRTFERLVKSKTGKSPLFWLRLLRMRRTAAMLAASGSALSEVALDGGYCDQSHMNREFRLWLGITPAALRTDTRWQQAFVKGYD